ncbi:MAG: dipeptide epimerase, partial [Proteobacteria bacterium]|nr:dipeptide epimerase [Pseudomonadota bacterium]
RQIAELKPDIEAVDDRRALQQLLPPGGARSAIDCALWELEASEAGLTVRELAGIEATRPLQTVFTLGIDAPGAMAQAASQARDSTALKLKLAGDGLDGDRVKAVRKARPDAWLGADANQALNPESLASALPALVASDVRLLEQPFPIGRDHWLDGRPRPIPFAADESVQGLADVAGCVGRYDVINVKLDKCGGLTEALAMRDAIAAAGLGLMVGNMTGTSLAMAPAFLVGQACQVVDLDGPLLLEADRLPGMTYRNGLVDCPPGVWGDGGSVAPPVR